MKRALTKITYTVITLITVLFFSNPIFSEPPNLTLLKNEIKNYHDSGLYEKELTQAIKKAEHYIINQTEINQHKKSPKKLAIVLDVDETSLSNYSYMIKRDFTGTHAQFHNDHIEANAPAIKPMLALYKEAIAHGVDVFFVTGRSESEYDATKNNLNKIGFKKWSGLYLRPNKYTNKSIIPFKSHTRKLIAQKGYILIATIGDQYSDLQGGYAKKGFKLPNPYYYLP